jgi:hypothetical protein
MTSDERLSSPGQYSSSSSPKPHGEEKTLRTERLQIERKTFLFALKENPRGRFLRITEDVSGHRDTIIIPAPGLADFRKVIDAMAQELENSPPLPS